MPAALKTKHATFFDHTFLMMTEDEVKELPAAPVILHVYVVKAMWERQAALIDSDMLLE